MTRTITIEIGEGRKCDKCGESLEADVKRLTPGIVDALKRIAFYSSKTGKRIVFKHEFKHLLKSDSQGNNLTALRKNGLLAKPKDEVTKKEIVGAWIVTRRGWQFLAGEIQIPEYVTTFRGKIIEYADRHISIHDLKNVEPYYGEVERKPVTEEGVLL